MLNRSNENNYPTGENKKETEREREEDRDDTYYTGRCFMVRALIKIST